MLKLLTVFILCFGEAAAQFGALPPNIPQFGAPSSNIIEEIPPGGGGPPGGGFGLPPLPGIPGIPDTQSRPGADGEPEGQSYQTGCTIGTKWVEENIKFECFQSGLTSGKRPIACVDENEKEMKDKEQRKIGSFLYECRHEDTLTYVYDVIKCFTTNEETPLEIGQETNEDGGLYVCSRDDDTFEVTLAYSQSSECKYEGKTYQNREVVVIGDVELKCSLIPSRNEMQMVATGCKTVEEEIIAVRKYGTSAGVRVECVRDYDNIKNARLKEVSDGCTDDKGDFHPAGTEWENHNNKYKCIKRGSVPQIRMESCIITVNYNDPENGPTTQKLVVAANQVAKADDGNFYLCTEKQTPKEEPQIAVNQEAPSVTQTPGTTGTQTTGSTTTPGTTTSGTTTTPNTASTTSPLTPEESPEEGAEGSTANEGPQEDPTFAPEPLPKGLTECKNGKALLEVWVVDNVRYQCKWNGKPVVKPVDCTYNGNDSVKKNQVKKIFFGIAFQCKKLPDGDLKWHRFSFQEYNEWEKRDAYELSAKGNRGTGYTETGECAPGYEEDGNFCLDTNECEDGLDTCNHMERCSNTPGDFACFCTTGYSRDSHTGNCMQPGTSDGMEKCVC